LLRSQSSHVHFLRSAWLQHLQNRSQASPDVKPFLHLSPRHFLAVALSTSHHGWRTSLALNQGTPKGLTEIFSVPFHAHSPYTAPQAPLFPVLWWLFDCRNTATRSAKKAPCKHRFFCFTWGVSWSANSIAVGLCSFFWKIAKENPIKKQHLINGNLPKKSSAQVKTISRLKANSKVSFVLAFG
jgi:hypothetical protein